MKKKIITYSILATTLFTCLSGGINAFAFTNEVNVKYSPSTIIKEGNYSIKMPKAIEFTEKQRTLPIDLKLCNLNGSDYTGGDISIESKVSSKNGFKLKLTDGSDELEYLLTYGEVIVKQQSGEQVIGKLTKSDSILKGIVTLPETSQASTSGEYSDVITYTITKS